MPHDEAPETAENVMFINFKNSDTALPTVKISGALYVSAGALWYKGHGGTYTRLGAT